MKKSLTALSPEKLVEEFEARIRSMKDSSTFRVEILDRLNRVPSRQSTVEQTSPIPQRQPLTIAERKTGLAGANVHLGSPDKILDGIQHDFMD